MSSAAALRNKSPNLGLWCATGDPAVVDAASSVDPDWICIDCQHGVDLGSLDASLFTVMASYGTTSLVRVPSIDASAIGRALDLGANGIVAPLVKTPADAELAVAATKHAPNGTRSFGIQTRRVGPFDEQSYVVIQIETAESIDNLEAIASVSGVDALYIGPADLGLALAGTAVLDVDAMFDGDHPEVLQASLEVVAAAARAGISAGLHCDSGEQAIRAEEAGFSMMAVASDVGSVASRLAAELSSARD